MKLGIIGLVNEDIHHLYYPAESDYIKYFLDFFSLENQTYLLDWRSVNADGVSDRTYSISDSEFISLDLNSLDLLFVKNLGKIHLEQEAFLSFLNIIEKLENKVINNPVSMRNNLDKEYIIRLQEEGFLVVPTSNVNEFDLENLIHSKKDLNKLIIKPRYFGEGGVGVCKLSELNNDGALNQYLESYSPVILQPFLRGIYDGEFSLIFLGNRYSHGVLKQTERNDFRINEDFGTRYSGYAPTKEELDIAHSIIESWDDPIGITRVDMFRDNGTLYISEVEMVNPSFYIEELKNEEFFCQNLKTYFKELIN